ncbi:glycogen synthase [Candidatus Parcubacteria bacterium]|nr:glycogen synthase [Candidatus Parcubacteria bacterium]
MKKIKVLMAAAECAPYAKVGGLGDVVGSLPPAIKKLGVDIRLVLPLYGSISKQKYGLKKIYSELEVPSGRVLIKINIYKGKLPGSSVTVYFIDSPEYFSKDAVYAPGDNSERFLFFSLAALYAIPTLKWQPNIVHAQDSHVALMTDIIKVSNLEYIRDLKTLYTIHNFRYQGKTESKVLSTGNLHSKSFRPLSLDIRDGDVNYTVQGVLNADLINTVSLTYAKEIKTSAYGAGLEKIIRRRKDDLYGILNGIDTKFFDPRRDPYIDFNYSDKSVIKKKKNKTALQKQLGLPIDPDRPLVGLVSRLAWQKGVDLITGRLSRLKAQFVFLGTGALEYEKHLKDLAKKYPKQFSARIMFDIKLAQQIYAASDIFLMPSRFEPCGLGQMIAMRYGAVPVARATGGLKDTVTPQLGFCFKNVNKTELFNALKSALDIYYEHPAQWQQMQIRGMKQDFSWDRSAKEYVKLYRKLL